MERYARMGVYKAAFNDSVGFDYLTRSGDVHLDQHRIASYS